MEEYTIGLEEILVAELYGAKPTMSTSLVPDSDVEPETDSEKGSTDSALESLHAQLGRVSIAHTTEEPPWMGSEAEQDEKSIGEIFSDHKSSF